MVEGVIGTEAFVEARAYTCLRVSMGKRRGARTWAPILAPNGTNCRT